jgi:hypothetical protein
LKRSLLWVLIVIVGFSISCKSDNNTLKGPGTVFIHQRAASLQLYRKAFMKQAQNLKANGIEAYSLHRDLKDPYAYILTLKCSNLQKGVSFIRSPEYMSAMDKAWAKIPMIWYGLDTQERKYTNQPKMTGGIVIAINQVRDYDFWLKCFRSETHHHPGRKYKNSNYSIHHLPGDPAVAIVVHEASDVSKAPSFMISDPLNGEMEATGVIGLEIWYGINIEEGTF